jgi:hypothetical protein
MPKLLVHLFCLMLLAVGSATAAPRAELWSRWTAHDPGSMRQIDHAAFETLLLRYLRIGPDGVHRIPYGLITETDRMALDAYLADLSGIEIDAYNRDEQMAFWINLYNALVVRLVLEHYPVGSIRDINPAPGDAADGPWARKLIEVDGEALSLSDIEHRILRPIWSDPRVHYALSCGAVGCGNLQPEPYRGDQLEHQLSAAAMAYINDPRCIDMEDGQLYVSSIFRWFKDDFGGTDQGVINHLMAYAKPRLAMKLQHFERIAGDGFDWRLNDATP